MLFALDKRTGKPVYAGSLSVPRWGLVCPNPKCGAPVYLRAGGYRAPHFAHVRWSASDDCDLYHPFDSAAPWTTEVFPAPETPTEHRESRILRELALFISTDAALRASLVLRIPAADQEPKWDGEIRFATPTGESRKRQEHLVTDQYIRIPPKVDRYAGRLIGAVDEQYGQMITDGVNGISADKSVFRIDDGFGRRLGWNEEVSWGDDLILVFGAETSYKGFLQFIEAVSFQYQPLSLHPDYKCVELPLPDDSAVPPDVRAATVEYLEREVRPRRSRVLLLDPPAHHFSAEGEWVVASGAESIKLYRSKRESVTVVRDNGEDVSVQEISDDTVEFPIDSTGLYSAQVGTDSIKIRIEQCPFNSASTIKIKQGEKHFSIESLASSEQLCHQAVSDPDATVVEFDNPIYEKVVLINGQSWQSNEAFREKLRDNSLGVVLQVGSYLTLTLRRPKAAEPDAATQGEREIGDPERLALRSYLLNYGASARIKVPATVPEGQTAASSMRVSIGALPQLRWLNRRETKL